MNQFYEQLKTKDFSGGFPELDALARQDVVRKLVSAAKIYMDIHPRLITFSFTEFNEAGDMVEADRETIKNNMDIFRVADIEPLSTSKMEFNLYAVSIKKISKDGWEEFLRSLPDL